LGQNSNLVKRGTLTQILRSQIQTDDKTMLEIILVVMVDLWPVPSPIMLPLGFQWVSAVASSLLIFLWRSDHWSKNQTC